MARRLTRPFYRVRGLPWRQMTRIAPSLLGAAALLAAGLAMFNAREKATTAREKRAADSAFVASVRSDPSRADSVLAECRRSESLARAALRRPTAEAIGYYGIVTESRRRECAAWQAIITGNATAYPPASHPLAKKHD